MKSTRLPWIYSRLGLFCEVMIHSWLGHREGKKLVGRIPHILDLHYGYHVVLTTSIGLRMDFLCMNIEDSKSVIVGFVTI